MDTTNYLSTAQVCGELASHGVDEATVGRVFAARLEPENLDDPDRKYVIGVPCPGNRALLVVFRFGPGTPMAKLSPLDEGGPDWVPRWISVEGPFPREEAEAKSRELTA
jgi:hypothetical protein